MMMNDDWKLDEEEKNEALNDDDKEFDDEFLFDNKHFNTLVVHQKSDENANSKKQVLDVEKFIALYQNPSEKNELLQWLKENNYKTLLIEQIQENQDEDILTKLVCAYWEAGFDDEKDLMIFIPFLLSNNFNLVLEANSAIMGLARPFDETDTQKAIQMIEGAYNDLSSDTIVLIDEILELLKSNLSNE
ncbi:MAG TPA: hypothetical protein PK995_07270 [Bacteroidia bacterium]|nr:hypothetical protein [Bacteroidia bacterium]